MLLLTGLMGLIGYFLPVLLKIDELTIYYAIMTPLLVFIVSVLLSVLLHEKSKKKITDKLMVIYIVLGVALVAALIIHLFIYSASTFSYADVNGQSKNYIKGNVYKPGVEAYKKNRPDLSTDAKLLYDGFGGPEGRTDVWTADSIQHNFYAILFSYGLVVILAASLWSLLLSTYYEKWQNSPEEVLKKILKRNAKSNYDTYISTALLKKTEEAYKQIKYHIFLSYASAQRPAAENLYYALLNNGHMVFFDRESLPSGEEYNTSIYNAIGVSDLFVFLISPEAVSEHHYTLSEVKFASEKWPQSSGHILPVMAVETSYNIIPAYLSSVTIFTPAGNLTAETLAKINMMYQQTRQKV